ncbi:hypothetical protein NPJ82_09430 [Sphingomonas sp. NY01]|uniref:hypothetical protein n=1 Tax=Sphingomonas sp. NY01 TaxID=2968057 RepID=UPI00315CB6A3
MMTDATIVAVSLPACFPTVSSQRHHPNVDHRERSCTAGFSHPFENRLERDASFIAITARNQNDFRA